MVSRGLSIRGRVGFERSGSTVDSLLGYVQGEEVDGLTNGVAISISVLLSAEVRKSRRLSKVGLLNRKSSVSRGQRSNSHSRRHGSDVIKCRECSIR